jgi:hypothetical protein
MKQVFFSLLFLATSCYNVKTPVQDPPHQPVSEDCGNATVVKSIESVPFVMQKIGDFWCLNAPGLGERLIPCDQNLGAQFQVEGLQVLVSGDYPEWNPLPNVRYIGRPFFVKKLVRQE